MIALHQAIGDYRAVGKTPEHAMADNFQFEERLSGARRTDYEDHAAPAGDTSWGGHHAAYVKARVNRSGNAVPDTFAAINTDAHLGAIEDNQTIVRLEEIDWVLKEQAVDLATFVGWFQDAKGTDTKAVDAREALDLFVEEWNDRRDSRPIFAGFEGDVQDDLEAADWPHRLRDRWGLAHYDPLPGAPINVVLVSYKVREVRRGVPASQRSQPLFAYPTALDGPRNPWFFPAPAGLPFGRALDLQPDGNCDRHVAEVLHRRIDYKPSHLMKLGVISAGRPGYSLKTRRNDHLYCLQFHSDREDFGQAIPDHVVD